MEMRGEDNLLQMFDKLQVLNLSSEGADILRSMADSIRSALEKGLLLEQIILNQRNRTINDTLEEEHSPKKAKKKKNKSQNVESVNEQSENIVPTDRLDGNILNYIHPPGITNQIIDSVPSYPEPIVENRDGVSFKSQSSSIVGKIRPIDPSLLIDNRPISDYIERERTVLAGNGLVNHTVIMNTTAPSHQNQSSPQTNPSQDHRLNSFNTFSVSFIDNKTEKLFTREPEIEDKSGPNVTRQVASLHKENNVISHGESSNARGKFPPQSYEQPVMPTPFLLKSEIVEEQVLPKSETIIPFDMQCNFSTGSCDHESADTTAASDAVVNQWEPDGRLSPSSANNHQYNEDEDLYQVYIDAGKEATEEEVRGVFENKGLSTISVRVINRVQHSFGFVRLENEAGLKKALGLSCKLLVAGKKMTIRPYFKARDSSDAKGRNHKNLNNINYNKRKFQDDSECVPCKKNTFPMKSPTWHEGRDRTRSLSFTENPETDTNDNPHLPEGSISPADNRGIDSRLSKSSENLSEYCPESSRSRHRCYNGRRGRPASSERHSNRPSQRAPYSNTNQENRCQSSATDPDCFPRNSVNQEGRPQRWRGQFGQRTRNQRFNNRRFSRKPYYRNNQ